MIHYSADGTLAVVHGLLPVGRLVVAARLVLVEARQAVGRRLLLRTLTSAPGAARQSSMGAEELVEHLV